MKKTISFLLLFFSISSTFANLRSEVDRYIILSDRVIVDRSLKVDAQHQEFLGLDLVASSGIRSIISDVKSGTETSNPVTKQVNMFSLLSKYVNSERFIDFDIQVGFPLFDITYKKNKYFPSFFYQMNVGLMFTVANKVDPLNPSGQLYFKQDQKMGIHTIHKRNKELYQLSIYQLTRSDLLSTVTATSLATSGELFNLDDLNKEQKSVAIDLEYKKENKRDFYEVVLKEIKLLSQSDHETIYGHTPFIMAKYGRHYEWNGLSLKPFAGIHYRKNYPIHQGLFIGGQMKSLSRPLELTAKMSHQFLTLIPQVKFRYFRFNYTFKNPYRNPQDDVWVSSMHSINLAFPFP
ncbi:MAG: hypothetical protein GY909_17615 [Oligoflexia bacterium]|nr:hypothetical protein [Oligoflexia bacterium]